MGAYFRDIWIGMTTVIAGMQVTIKHFFMPAITVQYPHEQAPTFPATRARLVNHEDECGVCLSCNRVCPAKCFTIKGVRAGKDEDLGILPDGNPKKMHVVQFDINMSTCLFCGLCVDACDTGSLRWETPHEDSVYSRLEMINDFVTMPEEQKRELIEKDAARKAAAKAEREKKAAAKAKAKQEAAPDESDQKSVAGEPEGKNVVEKEDSEVEKPDSPDNKSEGEEPTPAS